MNRKSGELLEISVLTFIGMFVGAILGLALTSLIIFLSYLMGDHYLLWGAAFGASTVLLLGVRSVYKFLKADVLRQEILKIEGVTKVEYNIYYNRLIVYYEDRKDRKEIQDRLIYKVEMFWDPLNFPSLTLIPVSPNDLVC